MLLRSVIKLTDVTKLIIVRNSAGLIGTELAHILGAELARGIGLSEQLLGEKCTLSLRRMVRS